MENIITIEYNGTTIAYDEPANLWRFTLRGRDRNADSLAKAKEAIDKPVPADKAKPFEKFKAWLFKYSNTPEPITVTGVSEQNYRGTQVWITDSQKKRTKESVEGRIYQSTPENDVVVAQILDKLNQAEGLREQVNELRSSLKQVEIKPEE